MEKLGPYEVVRLIARGGQGTVFEVRAPGDPRRLALKRIDATLDVVARLRFEREGQLLARVRHPGVVRVHAAGQDEGGQPYLVLDLLDGPTLHARGVVPPARAAALVRDVAAAVGALHAAGVVHRDVTPRNVALVRGEDGAERPVLLDLGLAWAADGLDLTATGVALGTPGFLAPEQAKGEPTGPPTDVHALGALLYALLTGCPPTGGSSPLEALRAAEAPPPDPRELTRDVPPGLAALCARAMARPPGERPTAVELHGELTRWLAGGSSARSRWPAALPATLVVGAALVGAILTRALVVAHRGPGEPPATTSAPPRAAPGPTEPAPIAPIETAIEPEEPPDEPQEPEPGALALPAPPDPRERPAVEIPWTTLGVVPEARRPGLLAWTAFMGDDLVAGAQGSRTIVRYRLGGQGRALGGWTLPVGLPSGPTVAVDDQGRLLVGTARGLVRVAPRADEETTVAALGSDDLAWPMASGEAPDAIAVARDGRVVVGSPRRLVQLLRPGGDVELLRPCPPNVHALAFAGEREELVLVVHHERSAEPRTWPRGRVQRWDLERHQLVPLYETGALYAVVVDPATPRTFVVGGATELLHAGAPGKLGQPFGLVAQRTVEEGAIDTVFNGDVNPGYRLAHLLTTRALAVVPGGRLASLARGGVAGLRVWRRDAEGVWSTARAVTAGLGQRLAASPDGRWLAVGHQWGGPRDPGNRAVTVWPVERPR